MSDLAARPFRKLARNNRLANLRLLAACGALLPGEFEAPRTSFFPSLKATLNHMLTVDWFYVDALEGGTLGPAAWADKEPCGDIASLRAAQEAVDVRLLAVCEPLTAATLMADVHIHRGHRIQIDSCADILLHLFLHQTHHRGQAHAMLAGSSVKPPQLDEFITVGDARFRAGEMTAIGWSEADLAER